MTAVAKPEPKRALALVQVVQERGDQITPFLPPGRTLDMVAHSVQALTLKNPQLLSAVPSQLVVAITRGLRAGLDIGEEWHLLTFKNKELSTKAGRDVFDVIGMADYKALAQMVIASGVVRYLDPQCVYERDEFAYALGLEKYLRHVPASKDRGKMIGAYVILTLRGTTKEFFWLPIDDIETVRAKSKQWNPNKVRDCPPWYALKCAIRQAVKLLPKDRRLAAAMEAVEQDEAAEVEGQFEPVMAGAVPTDVDPETGEDLSYDGSGNLNDLLQDDAGTPEHRDAVREGH